jgi:nucleotide-binding universal stress UspA family protein
MNILVGYIPTPEGLAALHWATEHAKLTGGSLAVLNTARDGDYSDPVFASAQDIDAVEADLAKRGIPYEVHRPTDGAPAAEAIVRLAGEIDADLIVIGLRRRSRRQTSHRQLGSGDPARGRLPGGRGQAQGLIPVSDDAVRCRPIRF